MKLTHVVLAVAVGVAFSAVVAVVNAIDPILGTRWFSVPLVAAAACGANAMLIMIRALRRGSPEDPD
jgi:hypothetical protein